MPHIWATGGRRWQGGGRGGGGQGKRAAACRTAAQLHAARRPRHLAASALGPGARAASTPVRSRRGAHRAHGLEEAGLWRLPQLLAHQQHHALAQDTGAVTAGVARGDGESGGGGAALGRRRHRCRPTAQAAAGPPSCAASARSGVRAGSPQGQGGTSPPPHLPISSAAPPPHLPASPPPQPPRLPAPSPLDARRELLEEAPHRDQRHAGPKRGQHKRHPPSGVVDADGQPGPGVGGAVGGAGLRGYDGGVGAVVGRRRSAVAAAAQRQAALHPPRPPRGARTPSRPPPQLGGRACAPWPRPPLCPPAPAPAPQPLT